ncbi:glycoside hydrolase family 6 protein [Mycobacterium sp. PDNC021]|uniref:glycoside hydrolase family 6 protein n=1 Tax=Mycobacterium sp. PDNC021 TaxID=3391399 RepID=UPI003AAEF606
MTWAACRAWARRTAVVLALTTVCGAVLTSVPSVQRVSVPVRLLVDRASNPLVGIPFYVDPTSSAAIAANEAVPRSPELDLIAGTATARWFDEKTAVGSAAAAARGYVSAAADAEAMPVVAIYGIPHRDCGSYSAGGLGSAEEYRSWITELARGFGPYPVTIIVEPDAITSADCLAIGAQHERTELLRFAVDTFAQNSGAVVYLDAGHSRWLSPQTLAQRLEAAGIAHAHGFSLNVSNFFGTAEEADFGEAVSELTNGARYVIDTSRNGVGPAAEEPLAWCNPPGRALGSAPSAETGYPHADAYLWIKRPGESDGNCRPGDPSSGHFYGSYAIDLVRNRPS